MFENYTTGTYYYKITKSSYIIEDGEIDVVDEDVYTTIEIEEKGNWASIEETRHKTGLERDEISDDNLMVCIQSAQEGIKEDLNVKVTNVEVEYKDGHYQLPKYPIADTDFDKRITPDDITLYKWSDENDPSTREELEIKGIYPELGKVNAEENSYVTATYSYYLADRLPNWEVLKDAVCYKAGYEAMGRIRGKVPAYMKTGGLTIDDENPGQRFERAYNKKLRKLKRLMYSSG